jgi:DNA-binding GntR family transcriptional regulator
VLVGLSESPRLIRMHQTLLTETRMCVLALEGTYPLSDVRVPEHKGIADAIGDGDAEKVDRLIIAHMDDAVGRLAPKFPSAAKQQRSKH